MRALIPLLPLLSSAAIAGPQPTTQAAAPQPTAQAAPQISANPGTAVFDARLPKEPFFKQADIRGNIRSSVRVEAAPNNVGVKVRVSFSNLPKEGGPFLYHIHVKDVPEDGNCTQTEGHLDPTNRGEMPPCDASKPESCQVGDLSGKYGAILEDPFEAEFLDPFSSLKEDDASYVGNRSFAVHFNNKTRITCANFKEDSSQALPFPLSLLSEVESILEGKRP